MKKNQNETDFDDNIAIIIEYSKVDHLQYYKQKLFSEQNELKSRHQTFFPSREASSEQLLCLKTTKDHDNCKK